MLPDLSAIDQIYPFDQWSMEDRFYNSYIIFGFPNNTSIREIRQFISTVTNIPPQYICSIDFIVDKWIDVIGFKKFDKNMNDLHDSFFIDNHILFPSQKVLDDFLYSCEAELENMRLKQWKSRMKKQLIKNRTLNGGLLNWMERRMRLQNQEITVTFKEKTKQDLIAEISLANHTQPDDDILSVKTMIVDQGLFIIPNLPKKRKSNKTKHKCINFNKRKVSFNSNLDKVTYSKNQAPNLLLSAPILNDSLLIGSYNCRGWNLHFHEIQNLFFTHNLAVLFLPESRLNKFQSPNTSLIPAIIPKSSSTQGIAVMLHPFIITNKLHKIIEIGDYHITLQINDHLITGLYLPTTNNLSLARKKQYLLNNKLIQASDYILGDFNMSLHSPHLLSSFPFHKRASNNTATFRKLTFIDHVFYLNHYTPPSILVDYNYSDHALISFNIPIQLKSNLKRKINWNGLNHYSKSLFFKQSVEKEILNLPSNLSNSNYLLLIIQIIKKNAKTIFGTHLPSKSHYLKVNSSFNNIQEYRFILKKISTEGNLLSNLKRWKKSRIKLYSPMFIDPEFSPTILNNWSKEIWDHNLSLIPEYLPSISISPAELNHAFDLLPNQKAAGFTLIPIRAYKILAKTLSHILSNLCYTGLPTFIFKTKLILIHKKGSINCPENYRPIGLQDGIVKAITKALLPRLEPEITKLPYSQRGFRPHFSTLHCLLEINKNLNLHYPSIFYDLYKAFDTLLHEDILHLNIDPSTKLFIYQIQKCTKYQYKDFYWYPKRGYVQGSCLSPLLSILSFNLTNQEAFIKSNLIEFADDKSIQNNRLEPLLKDNENIQNAYATKGQKFNISKSFVLNVPNNILPNFLHPVSSQKYLGLPINSNGIDLSLYILQTKRKITENAYLMQKLGLSHTGFSFQNQINIFKSFIQSLAAYALPLFNLHHIISLQTCLLKALSNIHHYNLLHVNEKWVYIVHNIKPLFLIRNKTLFKLKSTIKTDDPVFSIIHNFKEFQYKKINEDELTTYFISSKNKYRKFIADIKAA